VSEPVVAETVVMLFMLFVLPCLYIIMLRE
jgi:hypothetical protein